MSNPKAVPIQPKPANERGGTGVASQVTPVRTQRAGPLVFVNSSDLNTEGERRGNRKMVKKWAMLNRNVRHLQPSVSQGKAQFLSWDLKATERESSSVSPETDDTLIAGEDREKQLTIATNSIRKAKAAQPTVKLVNHTITSQYNNLGLDADPHVKALLHWFIKGGPGDYETSGGRLATCNRLAFPMISQSPAALSSLIAALEVNPFSPIRSGNGQYRDHWISLALTNTNTLLQSSKPSQEVFMCVSLLMWVAHHMGDEQALRVHVYGYAALMVKHWQLFCSTPYFRNGPFFWTFPSNEGNILPETRSPPESKSPTPEMRRHVENSVLAQMQVGGHVSSELLRFLPHLPAMQALIPDKPGQIDIVTAKDLLSYVWYIARTLKSLETFAISHLEQCVRQAVLVIYYASVWRNAQDGVGWMVGSMQSAITPPDIAWLMDDHSEVLMWLCLTAGHFAKDYSREWWLDLLVSVRHATGIASYVEARHIIESKLLWTRWLDQAAESFWEETTAIMKELQLPWEKENP